MKKLNNRTANAIIWAAMIVASALLVDKLAADAASNVAFILVMIHIAGWFVADQMVSQGSSKDTPGKC